MRNKLIVILRSDLEPAYASVQGGHAIASFCLEHPDLAREWNNEYLIFVQVKNIFRLEDWIYKLKSYEIPFSSFTEPDLGDALTSIAFLEDEKFSKKLNLFKVGKSS